MPTVDERVAGCIDERMADLITKLSVNDDSVAASYADAQMVGLKDELKIRVCPALSTPNELGSSCHSWQCHGRCHYSGKSSPGVGNRCQRTVRTFIFFRGVGIPPTSCVQLHSTCSTCIFLPQVVVTANDPLHAWEMV